MQPKLLFLIALAMLANTLAAQTPYGNNPAAGHYFDARGFKLYYETYGQGEPLLLLHGNGGSIVNMANQIPFFSEHYKVIAIDTRAHGKSMDPADSLSFEQIVDDFSALLDNLHLDSCYVIGWSDGGIDAILLAIRHPDKVKKMAFTGANLTPDTLGLTPFVFDLIKKEHNNLKTKQQTPQIKNELKIVDLDLYQPTSTRAARQTGAHEDPATTTMRSLSSIPSSLPGTSPSPICGSSPTRAIPSRSTKRISSTR